MAEGLIKATEEALRSIHRIQREIGPIMFYQTGVCCESGLPICFRLDEFILGNKDILLGRVNNTPVYTDIRQLEKWARSELILDVAEGKPEQFSIAAGNNMHFVTKSRLVKPDTDIG